MMNKYCKECNKALETIIDGQKCCLKPCGTYRSKRTVHSPRDSVAVSPIPSPKTMGALCPSGPIQALEGTDGATLPTPQSIKTRAESSLATLSDERYSELMTVGARYSESTLKKHTWVINMYTAFCSAYALTLWPMDPIIVSGFIRFLGLEARYAVGSIEDVIIPALKRLHTESQGEPPSLETSQYMAQALKDVKNSKSSLKHPQGTEPAIIPDIQRIIELTPQGVVTKAAEALLWLVAISTGARAVTCFHVTIGDIAQIYKNPASTTYFVQLCFRVTKGNPKWNHIVTLEGDPSRASSLNVVYWLNEHLKKSFNMAIEGFQDWHWSQDMKDKKMWPWSKDSMRELFKSRAISAGFPAALFTFHSLRAGFICSALLKAGSDANAVQAVLENTAFIAGWAPHQAAQLRYVKTCAKKTLVSSRMIMPAEEELGGGIIDPFLTSSEAFHSVTIGDPSWRTDENYKSFVELVNKQFHNSTLTADENKSLAKSCWRTAFTKYVQGNRELEATASALYKSRPNWKVPQYRSATEADVRERVGRNKIVELLHSNFEALATVVEEFTSFVENKVVLEVPLVQYKKKVRVATIAVRETFNNGHRKRKFWTENEDLILATGKADKKSWVAMAEALPDRTNVDCKDRWRVLVKKHGSDEAAIAHILEGHT